MVTSISPDASDFETRLFSSGLIPIESSHFCPARFYFACAVQLELTWFEDWSPCPVRFYFACAVQLELTSSEVWSPCPVRFYFACTVQLELT